MTGETFLEKLWVGNTSRQQEEEFNCLMNALRFMWFNSWNSDMFFTLVLTGDDVVGSVLRYRL